MVGLPASALAYMEYVWWLSDNDSWGDHCYYAVITSAMNSLDIFTKHRVACNCESIEQLQLIHNANKSELRKMNLNRDIFF